MFSKESCVKFRRPRSGKGAAREGTYMVLGFCSWCCCGSDFHSYSGSLGLSMLCTASISASFSVSVSGPSSLGSSIVSPSAEEEFWFFLAGFRIESGNAGWWGELL